jgi:asparagine synthase (glutamine-hydrolysing)
MCGIAGILTAPNAAPVDLQQLIRLRDCLRHRGPDSEGLHLDPHWGLGIRRLSIIDLQTGDQPFYGEDGQTCVVMNGEIYNFADLRQSLVAAGHHFVSRSDTEVVVHGYEAWGIEGLLARLNGMYAFALLDRRRRRLCIARDRLGEKPLYYHATPRRFVFASELSALVMTGEADLEIDRTALYYYLAVHFVPGDRTVVSGVQKLLPGHYLDIPLDTLEPRRVCYWQLREMPLGHRAPAELLAELVDLVREAVRSRMVADVPIGAYLSGGVDSSVMVSLMTDFAQTVDTFSIGFEDAPLDESEHSRRVAEALGTRHHHFLFDVAKVQDILPEVIAHMDEPIGDPALLPVYWLSRDARRFVKVALSGEGADEIFGGYGYYRDRAGMSSRLSRLVKRIRRFVHPVDPSWRSFLPSGTETLSGFPAITTHQERLRLLGGRLSEDRDPWLEWLGEQANRIGDGLRVAALGDILTWLPDDLLMKLDKMSMANSLEGRAPYLDHRLVEFAFNLPAELKLGPNSEKLALRQAFGDRLPLGIGQRPKQGFVLPMRRWLSGELRELLRDASAERRDDGLDHGALAASVSDQLRRGIDRERFLYALLVYRLWFRAMEARRDFPSAACAVHEPG